MDGNVFEIIANKSSFWNVWSMWFVEMPYWWWKEWPMVACPLSCIGCWLYLLSLEGLMYEILFLHLCTSLGCFCPRTIFSKKGISQVVISDLHVHNAKDNRQRCSRLSKWYSLQCLGPWMNHLSPVWSSTFRFMFLNVSRCVSLVWWRRIFTLVSCPCSCFYTLPKFCFIPLKRFHSEIAFFVSSTLYCHFP